MQNEIQMLETLKTDFLGMRFEVEYDKYVLSGIAEGLTVTERMHFVDWSDACDWAGRSTLNTECPFVILEMRNPVTGEMEKF
jgi:hypothetical protein